MEDVLNGRPDMTTPNHADNNFNVALSLAGFHDATWVGDLGDLQKLFDAAEFVRGKQAAQPVVPFAYWAQSVHGRVYDERGGGMGLEWKPLYASPPPAAPKQAAQPVAYSVDLNGHDDYLCWADVATSTYADRPMRGLVWSDASPPPHQSPKAEGDGTP